MEISFLVFLNIDNYSLSNICKPSAVFLVGGDWQPDKWYDNRECCFHYVMSIEWENHHVILYLGIDFIIMHSQQDIFTAWCDCVKKKGFVSISFSRLMQILSSILKLHNELRYPCFCQTCFFPDRDKIQDYWFYLYHNSQQQTQLHEHPV